MTPRTAVPDRLQSGAVLEHRLCAPQTRASERQGGRAGLPAGPGGSAGHIHSAICPHRASLGRRVTGGLGGHLRLHAAFGWCRVDAASEARRQAHRCHCCGRLLVPLCLQQLQLALELLRWLKYCSGLVAAPELRLRPPRCPLPKPLDQTPVQDLKLPEQTLRLGLSWAVVAMAELDQLLALPAPPPHPDQSNGRPRPSNRRPIECEPVGRPSAAWLKLLAEVAKQLQLLQAAPACC